MTERGVLSTMSSSRRWPACWPLLVGLLQTSCLLLGGCGGHDTEKQIFVENPGPRSGCTLGSPGVAPLSGAILVPVSVTSSADVTLVFTYSSDGGTTFAQATPTVDSLLANPATGVTPSGSLSFEWDSAADLPGVPPVEVLFRLQANPAAGSCQVVVTVSNAREPECALTPPATQPAGTLVAVTAELFDSEGDSGRATLCFSTDGGATFLPAILSAAAAGTLAPFVPDDAAVPCAGGGGQVTGLPPGMPVTLTWDAVASGLDRTQIESAILRLHVEDGTTAGTGPYSSCETQVQVLANQAPTCRIIEPQGGSLTGSVEVMLEVTDPDDATLDLAFEYSTDGGNTFAPATAAAGSPLPSPAPASPISASAVSLYWDAEADLPGGSSLAILFRVTATDGADDGGSRPVACTTPFGWGSTPVEALLELHAVTTLGARGTPNPGAPTTGNPAGNYAGLTTRELSTGVSLAAGGSPALLFALGEMTRPAIEGVFALAGAVDLSEAVNPWGTTGYTSADPGIVSVAADGTLSALGANACTEVTATFTPDPVALPGSLITAVAYAACVDLAGVDHATRQAAGVGGSPRLAVGELDADLPGLPGGPVPGGAGSTVGLRLVVNTGSSELAAHSIEVSFDAVRLAVDTDAPGTLMGVRGSSTSYAGPTLVNPLVPGQVSFNHFYIGPPVTGVFDLAEVRFDVLAAGDAAVQTTVCVLGDSATDPIGALGPRVAPAATGTVKIP